MTANGMHLLTNCQIIVMPLDRSTCIIFPIPILWSVKMLAYYTASTEPLKTPRFVLQEISMAYTVMCAIKYAGFSARCGTSVAKCRREWRYSRALLDLKNERLKPWTTRDLCDIARFLCRHDKFAIGYTGVYKKENRNYPLTQAYIMHSILWKYSLHSVCRCQNRHSSSCDSGDKLMTKFGQ